ncbi:hypothetical protein [Asanoa iriomotensis]|uniref:DUF4333 domain-containing protein n=1 Tax=Asanoa iriomotensis TaxID=234613 RepID=A0ABQ4CB01_9ACTN|nr:hypothetical protein [Asanoa iriomotensis]GIF59939.1 hypothetical protein Air01nite_60340 [Asanoa iriomotensis]
MLDDLQTAPEDDPEAKTRRTRRAALVIGGGAVLMLVALGVAAVTLAPSGSAPAGPSTDLLAQSQRVCDADGQGTKVQDNGATLVVDNTGTKDTSGVSLTGLECILEETKVPEDIKQRMFSTRTRDGKVEGTWPGFRATWTYDPAQGLDFTITRTA